MAGTLGDMKSRIADEIARSDLSSQIDLAIKSAIAAYQQDRFRFSESTLSTPATFETMSGQGVYTATDLPAIATCFKIDYVNLLVGSASIVDLVLRKPEELILYNQQSGTMGGQPSWYAYGGNELILAPVPDQAYTVNLGLLRNISAPETDSETGNPWMTDAEMLIRARAKYELALNVTGDQDLAVTMSPFLPNGAAYREWVRLRSIANRLAATSRITPVQF